MNKKLGRTEPSDCLMQRAEFHPDKVSRDNLQMLKEVEKRQGIYGFVGSLRGGKDATQNMSQHKIGDLYAYESFKSLGTITKRPTSLALYNIMPSSLKNKNLNKIHKGFQKRVKKVDDLWV